MLIHLILRFTRPLRVLLKRLLSITASTTKTSMVRDINNTSAASYLQGLGYLDKDSSTLDIASFSLGAGSTADYSDTLSAPLNEAAASLVNIKFTGIDNTTLDGKYMSLPGAISFLTTGNYKIAAIKERTGSTLTIRIQFANTSGSGTTVPAITVDTIAYFYKAPW